MACSTSGRRNLQVRPSLRPGRMPRRAYPSTVYGFRSSSTACLLRPVWRRSKQGSDVVRWRYVRDVGPLAVSMNWSATTLVFGAAQTPLTRARTWRRT
jgi:hypothetical protein